MRISDWSSDVCSSDLRAEPVPAIVNRPPDCRYADPPLPIWSVRAESAASMERSPVASNLPVLLSCSLIDAESAPPDCNVPLLVRSEEHTSELQSLMRISYAVFCLKTKNHKINKSESKIQTHDQKK